MVKRYGLLWFIMGCAAALGMVAALVLTMPRGAGELVRQLEAQLSPPPATAESIVEMVVEMVGINRSSQQPVVVLRDKYGVMLLPVLVGPLEADAIAVVLAGVDVPRPLSSDLMRFIIGCMGASVEQVTIVRVDGGVFYANLMLRKDGQIIELDARPSDAIALALRASAPIYAERHVLEKAGVLPETRLDKSPTA